MIINVKNTPELPDVPKQGTSKSAAYDVIAVSEPEIVGEKDGEYWKRIDYIQYHTALYAAPQKDSYSKDYHVLVHPRSSVSKYNLLLANGIGLIDTDYRNEYLVRFKYVWQPEDMWWTTESIPDVKDQARKTIRGHVNVERIYKKGDKVCQLVVEPTTDVEWVKVEELDKTERTGGFGSTDNVKSIPVGQSNTLTISKEAAAKASEATRIKSQPLPGVKPVEHEKKYETRVDLIEQWKKAGGVQEAGPGYETLIKEREKQLGNPK